MLSINTSFTGNKLLAVMQHVFASQEKLCCHYSVFKQNNEEINGKKSVLRLQYLRLFASENSYQCQIFIPVCMYKINNYSWLVRFYDFYYAFVVKDC